MCMCVCTRSIRCNLNPIPGGDYNVLYYRSRHEYSCGPRRSIRFGATRNKEIVISRDTVRQISLPTCQPPRALSSSAATPPDRKLSISGYTAPGQHRVHTIQQRRLYWALFLQPGGGQCFFPYLFSENRSLITFRSSKMRDICNLFYCASSVCMDPSLFAALNLFSCSMKLLSTTAFLYISVVKEDYR